MLSAYLPLLLAEIREAPALIGLRDDGELGGSRSPSSLRSSPRGESGGYTALYYSLRAVASALAVPIAGLMIAVTDSYRSLFLFGGTATLAALLPLAFAPSPQTAADLTRHLR